MHDFEIILVLLAGVLISNLFNQRFPKIPAPLVQLVLGISMVVLPIPFEGTVLDPELFLVLFIAPLLFEEAKKADKPALWRYQRPVLSLAVGLVFATVMSVGFALNWLVPSIPLAAAFAFAAALAPTDAVAVFSLRNISTVSEQQSELLKGEALLNDAASIVSFQFAIAAVLTASFSLLDAAISFFFMFIGGLALGVGLMLIRYLVMRIITVSGIESSTFFVLFEIVTPCLVYLVAELVHVSGIIAVVAAGITYSFAPRGYTPVRARNSIVSSSVWSLVTFTINGVVFLMLGIQIPGIMRNIIEENDSPIAFYVLSAFVVLGVILVIRFIWILIMHRNTHLAIEAAGAGGLKADESEPIPIHAATVAEEFDDPENLQFTIDFERAGAQLTGSEPFYAEMDQQRADRQAAARLMLRERQRTRREAEKRQRLLAHSEPHYWRKHFVDALQLTIGGPKGSITLALIFAIPVALSDGSMFPERDHITFIASCVILLSLVLTSTIMPFVSPKASQTSQTDDEVPAMIVILRSVVNRIIENDELADSIVSDRVIRQYNERIRRLMDTNALEDYEELQMWAEIVTWERQHTMLLIADKRVNWFVGVYYLNTLSRQLARLEHRSPFIMGMRSFWEQIILVFSGNRGAVPVDKTGDAKSIAADGGDSGDAGGGGVESGVAATGAAAGGVATNGGGDLADAASDSGATSRQPLPRLRLRGMRYENLTFVLDRLEALRQEVEDIEIESTFSPGIVNRFVSDTSHRLESMTLRYRARAQMLADSPAGGIAERERMEMRLSILALEWEREAIVNALQAEQITRQTARQMLDSVAAMELDIEEFLD